MGPVVPRCLPLAALAAGLALLAAPSPALAHAQLQGTVPARGATVRGEPTAVVFRFNEPVEGNFGAVRVFDAHGARADSGDAFHPGGVGPRLGVHLRPHLPNGTYTATYRVVSADGHIVSSGFVFSVGSAGLAPRQSVGQLIGGARTGPVTEAAFGVARGVQYLAIGLAIGAIVFLLAVWLPALRASAGGGSGWRSGSEAFARRLRGGLIGVALAGALSAVLGVVFEGAEAAGISGFAALQPRILREVLSTRFGMVWGIGALAWVLLAGSVIPLLARRPARAPVLKPAELGATGLALPERPGAPLLALVAVPAALLAALPAFAGHAATQHPQALLLPINVVHVLAMSVWLGGLASLLFVVPAATRRLEPGNRGRLLAATFLRFSPLALASVLALLTSGLIQAYVYVRTPAHLVDDPFGRAVLVKFLLLMALIGLGAYQRRRSVPRLERIAAEGAPPGGVGLLLRRALRAEVALIVVVLGVTAALTSYAPSIAAQSGPFSATRTIGPAQLQVTVDPARVGTNEVHLYLINPKDGTQFTGAREVNLAESLPAKGIGPLNQGADKAGPGHYVLPAALLNVPGTWQVQITVRVSQFDEYTTVVKVPVR